MGYSALMYRGTLFTTDSLSRPENPNVLFKDSKSDQQYDIQPTQSTIMILELFLLFLLSSNETGPDYKLRCINNEKDS